MPYQPFFTFIARIKSKLLSWLNRKPQTPKKRVYEVQSSLPAEEPDRISPTKAYADQRQKEPHNRKRKPSKAMRHLYHLR